MKSYTIPTYTMDPITTGILLLGLPIFALFCFGGWLLWRSRKRGVQPKQLNPDFAKYLRTGGEYGNMDWYGWRADGMTNAY